MKKLDDLSVLVPENEDIIGRGHPRRFDWRGAWNRSLRFRLLALGMMPLLMAFPLVMAALSILGGDRAEEMLLANLRGQLGASSTYLEQTRRQTGQQLGQLVRSERIRTLLSSNSDPKNVLVFDDCDSILLDDIALNILKAALDSGKKRRIYWNSDSSMLRREGVPDQFDFKGSVIFITNLKFDNLKSKKLQDHLEALQSRCHFLDLTLNTMRDKFLRIKQIFRKGDLFQDYDFTAEQGEEILDFMYANRDRLREMSLRMALKIADLTKISNNWKSLAESTCMRG